MTRAPAGGDTETLALEGRLVRISNPGRVLWPATGFTKRRMIDYYLAVAPALLPHVRGRPITLGRWPEGVDRPGWFQAQCRGRPSWLPVHTVEGRRETLRYCLVEDAAALAWLANLGTIELHPFLWRTDGSARAAPPRPDWLVVDLDPGRPASLADACRVALLVRAELDRIGLAAWPKTSGALGLHLYVPLGPDATFEEAKALARSLAGRLAASRPELVVDRIDRAARAGRVYLDWIQNTAARSTVAPYSLRATDVPLVSTPVTWDEVEEAARTGRDGRLRFGPAEALRRLERLGDLFAPVLARPGEATPRAVR